MRSLSYIGFVAPKNPRKARSCSEILYLSWQFKIDLSDYFDKASHMGLLTAWGHIYLACASHLRSEAKTLVNPGSSAEENLTMLEWFACMLWAS